jgi:BlaI family transcriptional regulator, penicillinase repressor
LPNYYQRSNTGAVPPYELGPLEMRVLGLLGKSDPRSVDDVRRELASAGTPLAYTTVLTVLSRLHDKGLVRRDKEGRRYVYVQARPAASAQKTILTRIKRALFRSDRVRPFALLLDDERLTEEELRELRCLIDSKLEAKK